MYDRYVAENAEDERLVDAAQRRIAARRQIIDGLAQLHPEYVATESTTTTTVMVVDESGAAPSEKEAIKPVGPIAGKGIAAIFADLPPGRLLTVNEIVSEFRMRGWTATKMSIRLAARRGVERGQFIRDDRDGQQTFGLAPVRPMMLEALG